MSEIEAKTIGRYHLLEEVGQGGMSVVYRAIQTDSGDTVAVKVLSTYVAQEPRFKARFDREVRMLSNMRHPNIVPILDYGEDQGKSYIVMPYYSGGTIQDLIEGEGMELRQVGELLADIAAGLEHAHRAGIVHRDVKPSNVLLDQEGTALVSDFGFAHVSDSSHSLTGSVLIGTPAFMSPEQCSGGEVDPRSDQYSLGAVLYQATTGKLPFEADTPMAVVIKHIHEPLPRPRYVNPYLPDVVAAVIERAMAKQPAERYESVAELRAAFAAALAESLDPKTGLPKPESIGPAPVTQVVERSEGSIWGSRRALVALALLLMIGIPAAAVSLGRDLLGGAGAGRQTATPNAALLATIDALSTANAERLEGSQVPGAVETAVAATVQAMGLFDSASATPTVTIDRLSATPTPTAPGSGGGSNGDGSDPPPPPSDTSSSPTDTPEASTDTPSSTDTPVPPTPTPTDTPMPPPPPPPGQPCLPGAPPGHPRYCTPTPQA